MKCLSSIIILLLIGQNLFSQVILVDGYVNEWTEDQLVWDDEGDNAGLDFEKLWLDYDDLYLYLRIDLDQDIILQRESDLAIFIDADDDATTGFPINGLGTEFSFYFDNNNGFINVNGGSENIGHEDVGFYVAPAFEASSFELAIRRDLGNLGATIGDQIKIAIIDDRPNGDVIPNENASIDISQSIEPNFQSVEIAKVEEADFRLMSMNVLFDNIFEVGTEDAYNRLLSAIDPDIIAFQEIYDHSSVQTAALVESFLPSENGEIWHHRKVGADLIVVSRYPILFDDWVDGNGAFVIDVNGEEILLFNVHFPCCDNDEGRDVEIDALLQYLRRTLDGEGPYNLPNNAPVFIVGDYNLVGDGQQLERLVTGDIRNNTFYGPDFQPDWGMGSLIDATPAVVNSNLSYTWYNEFSSYTGGRLDFLLYAGSSIYNAQHFVLDTRLLDQGSLFLNNLSQSDNEIASDHLPIVSDWSFSPLNIPVTAEFITSHIDCHGDCTGSIDIIASGGLPPYSYSINFGPLQSEPSFQELKAASYIINVFDSIGQFMEHSFVIEENDPIIILPYVDENDLTIEVSGGVPPYLFSIDGGLMFQTSNVFSGLPDGEYQILVQDAVNCIDSSYISIMTSSISNIDRAAVIQLNPNPFSDVVAVHIMDPTIGIDQFIIRNELGQSIELIESKNTDNLILDLGHLSEGNYIFEILFDDGSRAFKKMIRF